MVEYNVFGINIQSEFEYGFDMDEVMKYLSQYTWVIFTITFSFLLKY